MPVFSDYLLKTSPSVVQANLYVRLLNNSTGASYISDAVTDANGKFSFNTNPPPAGIYTVFTGSGPTIGGTPTATGDTQYVVTDPFDKLFILNPAYSANGKPIEKGGILFTPIAYGAVGNGVALDDGAFSALLAALPTINPFGTPSAQGHIYCPAGFVYLLSLPLVPTGSCVLSGGGYGSILRNTSSDLIQLNAGSASGLILEKLELVCNPGAGHIVTGTVMPGPSYIFRDLNMIQSNPAKSCVSFPGAQGMIIRDSIMEHTGPNRSVPILDIVQNGTINDNRFECLRLSDDLPLSATAYQMRLKAGTTGVGANNTIRAITFEQPVNGALQVIALYATLIEQISFWDIGANTTTANLLSIEPNSAQCHGTVIRHVYRSTGTLGASLYDIRVAGNTTWVSHCMQVASGTAFSVNFDTAGWLYFTCDHMHESVLYSGKWINTFVVGAGAGSTAVMSADPTASGYNTPLAGGYRVVTGGAGIAAGLLGSVRVMTMPSAKGASASVHPMNLAAAQANLYVSALTTNASYLQVDVSCVNVPAGTLDFEVRVNPGPMV